MTRLFPFVAMLTAGLCAPSAQAQQVIIPDPEIEAPARYVERKLADFRARLDRLKQGQKADAPDDFDGEATADALFQSFAGKGPKDLRVIREADEAAFDVDPLPLEGAYFLTGIRDLSLVSRFGTVTPRNARVPGNVAVDRDTALAFSLPQELTTRASASIARVVSNGECCLRFEAPEQAEGRPKCLQSVPAFSVEGQGADLRQVLSTTTGGGIAFDNITGDADGRLLTVPETGVGKITLSHTVFETEGAYCGQRYDASRGRYVSVNKLIRVDTAKETREISAEVKGIKFVAFGLPELDVANAGNAPQLNFFSKGQTTIGSLTMGAGAQGPLPAPVATYFDGAAESKSDGLRQFPTSVTVRMAGVSPFIAMPKGQLALSPAAVPGGTEVTWSLNDAFEVRHALSLNRISVEIKGLGKNGALLVGRDYETVVTIQGPVDFDEAGLALSFGGPVGWASTSGTVDRGDGKTEITNRFRPGGDLRPVIKISMTSPFGEVFTYDAGLIVQGRALGGLDLRVIRGEALSAITAAPVRQIDTFFPSTFPANPVKLSAHASFITDEGDLVSLQRALARAAVGSGFRPDGLLSSSNEGFLRRTRFSLSAPALFEVSPQIGAALIESQAGEAGGVARALTGGVATKISAPPVTVTSNALRLLREKGRFTLSVRGPADMSRYHARWTRRGFAPKDTAFEPGENGAVTTFETSERLAKVEIMEGEEVIATMLGVMASLPAQIRILPFRQVAEVVDKKQVEDFGQLAALKQDCTKSGASAENCKAERDAARDDLKERRGNQKDANAFLQKLDRAGKALVELADKMEVAAAVRGAPVPELGETICVWSIIGATDPLKVAQRVTRLRREAAGDFCFNVVTGVKAGFTPGAEIRVELTLLDKGAAAVARQTE